MFLNIKKMKKSIILIVSLFLVIALSSCLTVERKSYNMQLNKDGSGALTIDYYNIMAEISDGETKDDAKKYYNELMNDYYNGDVIKKLYPKAVVTKKEFYEKDGKLCAQVVLSFKNIAEVGFYKKEKKGDIMFALCASVFSETYVTSNGTYGGETMPVIFWGNKSKQINFITSIMPPSEKTMSLLPLYNENKK